MSFEEAFRRLAMDDLSDGWETEQEVVRVLATYIMRYLVRYFARLPEDIQKDVVQEVLLVIQEKGRTARYPKAFTRTWAKNKAFKALEGLKRMGIDAEPPEQSSEGDPDLERRRAFEAIEECLRELADDELRVIEGQYLDNPKTSMRELAEELGKPSSTISDMKKRALEKLRTCLKKKGINLDWLRDD